MYCEVVAKCGHVGRGKYIIKNFYIKAETRKEAAKTVRWLPRVKHHQKDAIQSVREVSYEEFESGKDRMKRDPYFSVKNSTDQRALDAVKKEEVYCEPIPLKHKKRDSVYYLRKRKIVENANFRDLRNGEETDG